MLPTNISNSFFLADTIDVTNSGNDVPKAITVNDITLSLIPKVVAILDALSTTKSLPIIIPAKPNKTIKHLCK